MRKLWCMKIILGEPIEYSDKILNNGQRPQPPETRLCEEKCFRPRGFLMIIRVDSMELKEDRSEKPAHP
jgi:hypothetical protein